MKENSNFARSMWIANHKDRFSFNLTVVAFYSNSVFCAIPTVFGLVLVWNITKNVFLRKDSVFLNYFLPLTFFGCHWGDIKLEAINNLYFFKFYSQLLAALKHGIRHPD